MIDAWTSRTPQSTEFPKVETDGVKKLLDVVKRQGTEIAEKTSNLFRTAGITITETLMTFANNVRVEGTLTSTGSASIGGQLNVTANTTLGGSVRVDDVMNVYGRVNVRNGAGFWALYDDNAVGAKFGPLTDDSTGLESAMGLLIQGPTSTGLRDVFRAKYEYSDGTTGVYIGQNNAAANYFNGWVNKVYLEAQSTGTGSDAGMWLHSAGDIRLTSSNFTLTIPWSTNSGAANMYLDGNGRIWRSSSSRRFKQDIEDAQTDTAAVLRMQPRTWRDKAEVEREPDTQTRYIGFIAEELDDLGLGEFVTRDEGGAAEGIAYDRLVAAVIPVLRDLDARLRSLEGPK